MDVHIERVSEHTAADLVRMVRGLAAFERLEGPDEDGARRLRADAVGPNARFEAYLATLEGRAVGAATLYPTYSTFRALPILFLEDLFVAEAYRRRGVGQALFDFCVSLARDRGCARLEWNVLRWNEEAIRFYERNGATPLDTWAWYAMDPREHDPR